MATATWCEWNLTDTTYATPTTSGITNTNWGNTDASNLTTTSFPISQNARSYWKNHAVKFTALGTQDAQNFRLWASVGYSGGVFTGSADILYFKTTGAQTITQPATTDPGGMAAIPSAEPASNVGGTATADGEGSHIFLTQVLVDAASTVGKSATLSFKYDLVG